MSISMLNYVFPVGFFGVYVGDFGCVCLCLFLCFCLLGFPVLVLGFRVVLGSCVSDAMIAN